MQAQEYEQIEKERLEFKELILDNPNYFGTALDPGLAKEFAPVYPMKGNTKYEELRCVGLYPEDDLLEAVIEVKLPYGFKGDLCTPGSKEYVAFYVDYKDGAGFISVGSPVEVNVHDIALVEEDHLFYAVRKPFIPQDYWPCDKPQVVVVRAILSWETLPTGPNYTPVWGNVFDLPVQIKPEHKGAIIIPAESLATAVEPLATEPPLGAIPVPGPALKPTADKLILVGSKAEIKELLSQSMAAEDEIKAAAEVEPERVELEEMMAANPNYFGSICKSQDPQEILEAVYQLPPNTVEILLPKLEENPEYLIPVQPMLQNTHYEELRCVGLYPEDDLLEAIIEVKRPYGFGGDLCAMGSKEYVAFYVDWGSGVYDHVGTAGVYVHDIPQAGDSPLFYAVKLRIPDIEKRLRDCSIENIVSVRAVLSWMWDPTPYGHTYNPPWGNVLTRKVQIRPENGASVQCAIEIVNEWHVDDIAQTGSDRGLAIKLDGSGHTVPGTYDRPFGGTIACWGNVNVGAVYYRFRYREDRPGAPWQNVLDKRTIRTVFGFTSTRAPDGEGWFSISDYINDDAAYPLVALVHWRSHGRDGSYVLRLELADATRTAITGQTYDVPILLDNSGIELYSFGGTPTPLPAAGVVVKDKADNYRKCGLFKGKDAIRIFGNFRDDYFRSFRLKVFGGNIAVSGVVIGSGRYDSPSTALNDTGIVGAGDGSLGQEIETLDLCDDVRVPQHPEKISCAYGIELHVSDRAIVGYLSGYQFKTTAHGRDAFVTFNWDPKGC